ncbi:MAG: ABC transporter permease, partial [Acetobacteraceae bacterium]|nr:ABC transporter permease [Acetobacteraceae bacterium]
MSGQLTLRAARSVPGTRGVPAALGFLPIGMLNLVLFALPMLVLACASVLRIREFTVTSTLTLDNYAFFLERPLYLWIFLKTVSLSLAVTGLCIVIAYPFALFLIGLPAQLQKPLLALVILPFWTSYLLRIYAWMTILGERGLVNKALIGLGVLGAPARVLLYSDFAVVIVCTYLYVPYSILALYTTLERLDWALVRAALDLGARPRQVFRHVLLPLSLPGIFTSFILVFIPMVGEYVTPALVGGARGLLIMNVIVSQVQALRFGIGSAMAFVVVGLIVAMV